MASAYCRGHLIVPGVVSVGQLMFLRRFLENVDRWVDLIAQQNRKAGIQNKRQMKSQLHIFMKTTQLDFYPNDC